MPAQDDDSPQVKEMYASLDRARALNERTNYYDKMSTGELFAFSAIAGTLITGVVAIVVAAMKQEKKALEEERARAEAERQRQLAFEDWMTTEENNGKNVYELADGRYLSVSRDADQMKYNIEQL